jgi:hypothetical protein
MKPKTKSEINLYSTIIVLTYGFLAYIFVDTLSMWASLILCAPLHIAYTLSGSFIGGMGLLYYLILLAEGIILWYAIRRAFIKIGKKK